MTTKNYSIVSISENVIREVSLEEGKHVGFWNGSLTFHNRRDSDFVDVTGLTKN